MKFGHVCHSAQLQKEPGIIWSEMDCACTATAYGCIRVFLLLHALFTNPQQASKHKVDFLNALKLEKALKEMPCLDECPMQCTQPQLAIDSKWIK